MLQCYKASPPSLPNPKHLTDFYLLSLAQKNKLRLATLDKRVEPTMLVGGEAVLHLIA